MAPDNEHAGHADTHLARVLHASGRLPLRDLTIALNQIRQQRLTDPGVSLASLLVESGAVDSDELTELLERPQTEVLTPGAQGASTTLAENSADPPGPARSRWQIGKRIGSYELEGLLGHGGMGVVFRARHLSTGKAVAIKGLLNNEDEEVVARFARETHAQSAADSHMNVAEVYEAGEVDGQGYLVLELLPGGDLQALLRDRTRLPGEEAAGIVAQLARGLAHVHSHRILHRDLKPANVLFAEDGTPKLVDFGLARLDRAEQLTLTGQVLGTPAFMAPEQALGLHEVDERTDVYGLGAVLFSCLTGTLPFDGPPLQVLTKVLEAMPVRPSTISPDLDPQLEAICLRAMAKDPDDRFQTAAELAQALEDWTPGPVSPTPDPDSGTPSPRLILFVVASLLVGFVAGLLARGGLHLPARTASPGPTASALALIPLSDSSPAAGPTATESLRETPATVTPRRPTRVKVDDLQRGAQVLVEEVAAGQVPGRMTARLAVVASIDRGDPSRVQLLLPQGQRLVSSTRVWFRRAAFGTGARVLTTRGAPSGTIRRRHGPMALVEHRDGSSWWAPISNLTLLDEGVAPGEDAAAEVQLVRWNSTHYPAIVVADPPTNKFVQVVWLADETSEWILRADLRPLPKKGTKVRWKNAAGKAVPGVVVRYHGSWIVEVGHNREERSLVQLSRVTVPKPK
jgi:serine/threonine protein kinase